MALEFSQMESAPLGSTTEPLQVADKVFPPWARCAGIGTVLLTASAAILTINLPGGAQHSNLFGTVITVIIGLMLACGSHAILPLARLRAWAGVLLGIPLMFFTSGSAEAAFQAAFAIGLVLLLGEKPGKLRVAAGTLLMLTALGLVGLGSLVIAFPGVISQLSYRKQTNPLPADGFVRTSHYRIGFPGSTWALLKPEIAKQRVSIFDLWAVRPDLDIHAAVICEEGEIDPDDFEQDVVGNYKASEIELLTREAFKTGSILHLKKHSQIEILDLLVVGRSHTYSVHCWSLPTQFSKAEPEFRKIFESFEALD